MRLLWRCLLLAALFFRLSPALSQRSYAAHSVLSNGNWYKIAVKGAGVHKMDLAFLQSLGISTQNLSAGSVRLYGNGGQMLAEANNGLWTDDLRELALWVEDGGDGILNGSDYVLFFAPGPHRWIKDSLNLRFEHQVNLYSDHSYYFLNISPGGKRIASVPATGNAAVTVNSFDERYFHELDTVNLLSSGKEWFGEEFSGAPGRTLIRSFTLPGQGIAAGTPILVRAAFIARSVGNGSSFRVHLNNQAVGNVQLPPVNGGIYDPVAAGGSFFFSGSAVAGDQSLQLDFIPGSFNAQGWLNWFEVFYRRELTLAGSAQLMFRDWQTVGGGQTGFRISNAGPDTRAWDITDPAEPVALEGSYAGGTLFFTREQDRLREFITFGSSGWRVPEARGRLANQDIHGSGPVDMLIVCPPEFTEEARRITDLHAQHQGLRSLVVNTEQVYNEFASGSPDPGAIRDCAKMFYDRYVNDPPNRLRYLLLFGDASFDPRGKTFPQVAGVPAYQSSNSLDPLNSYVSDDFFGFLEDHEDINSGLVMNLLDIGVGRVPAGNVAHARQFVDKLERYLAPQSLGPWRTRMSFVADDEDQNLHLQDAEQVNAVVSSVNGLFTPSKIYLDSYFQETGPGGARYPQANQASNNQVFNGTLIWNYNGHGGPRRLAEETILDQQIADQWNNAPRLPLFITATCDFAPYDQPAISSLGEHILVGQKNGAIALMTTTRVVFAFSNRVMNENYLRLALERRPDGSYRSLGEAVMDAKNFTYQHYPDIINNRKFTLLGDPALTLAFPVHNIRVTTINQLPANTADTLSAGETVTVEGEVTDLQGGLLNGFNGVLYPSLYDKARVVQTLGNDPGSPVTSFSSNENLLFRGKATVSGGRFSFSFKVPKDVHPTVGEGRISLYAENGSGDAAGVFRNIQVGGTGGATGTDAEGPEIKAYLNDEMFVNGGTVNENPLLILKLYDTSGINTTGLGIGHDLVATLDGDNRQFYILNDFYEAELDDPSRGRVRFQLPQLSPGVHTLDIRAWDGMNNSNEIRLDFIVASDGELVITRVLNYPNPFTTSTQFWFEHNRPGQLLEVKLEILTMTGRMIRAFSGRVVTEGNRFTGFDWDGRDEFGDRVGRGVYLYRLRVTDPKGLKKEQLEKLVVF